jgi:DNA gyrase subunit A
MKTREEDFVAQLIIDSTHAYLLCFTNTGRVYWLKVYEIPDVGAAGKGKSMASLLDLQPGEKVVTILPVRDLEEEGKYILFATRNGTSRRPRSRTSPTSWRAASSPSASTRTTSSSPPASPTAADIFLATHDGMAIRFNEHPHRHRKRLRQAHRHRRIPPHRARRQGVNNLKATAKVGKTMAILPVDETSELMVISQFGKMIRIDTKTIRAAGRSTQGRQAAQPRTGRQGRRSRRHSAWKRSRKTSRERCCSNGCHGGRRVRQTKF